MYIALMELRLCMPNTHIDAFTIYKYTTNSTSLYNYNSASLWYDHCEHDNWASRHLINQTM